MTKKRDEIFVEQRQRNIGLQRKAGLVILNQKVPTDLVGRALGLDNSNAKHILRQMASDGFARSNTVKSVTYWSSTPATRTNILLRRPTKDIGKFHKTAIKASKQIFAAVKAGKPVDFPCWI